MGQRVADAAPNPSGRVVVVNGSGSSEPLGAGGSDVIYSVRLPKGAACPGDSAHSDYRVQSYLVPTNAEPAKIVYQSIGPKVPGALALYKATTNAFVNEQTANAEKRGAPGTILPPPDMTFAIFTPADLHPGRYHMGIACSLYNVTKRYWAGQDIVFTADAKDKPGGFTWRLVGSQAAVSSGSSAKPVAAAVTGVVILVVVFSITRRMPKGNTK